MTPKERQLAAIRGELTDRISVDAIYIHNQPEIAKLMGVSPNQVLDELGIDGRVILLEYQNEFSTPSDNPDRIVWSTTLLDEYSSQYGTSRVYPLASAGNIADIDAYDWPDPNAYNYEKSAQVAKKYGNNYAVRGPFWVPVFCKACDLFGMENAMVKMMIEPDLRSTCPSTTALYQVHNSSVLLNPRRNKRLEQVVEVGLLRMIVSSTARMSACRSAARSSAIES